MATDLDRAALKSRLQTEVLQLAGRFGEATYDKMDGAWVHLSRFPLPRGWNKREVAILIDIAWRGPYYPHIPPHWFWTDRDLRTSDGRGINHFFPERGRYNSATDQQYLEKGWGAFCVHLDGWKPAAGSRYREGHTLLSYLNLMTLIFHDRRTLAGR